MRGFARVCRVEDSKVNALTRAIGVRGLEKTPRSLKADPVGPVLYRVVPRRVPCLVSPAAASGGRQPPVPDSAADR